jgi:hypothetical protein
LAACDDGRAALAAALGGGDSAAARTGGAAVLGICWRCAHVSGWLEKSLERN